MHDVDTFMFFKWFFKAFVAVFLVTHTFDITMAVFDVAQHVVSGAAGVIGGETSIDRRRSPRVHAGRAGSYGNPRIAPARYGNKPCQPMYENHVGADNGYPLRQNDRNIPVLLCFAYPFATMTNREWGQIGNNYLKGLFALGFQGFLIMICVGIYAVLVNEMVVADNLHSAIFSLAAYTVILCFSLFKSGALAKSIFNAH